MSQPEENAGAEVTKSADDNQVATTHAETKQVAATNRSDENEDNHIHSDRWQRIWCSDRRGEDDNLVKCKAVIAEADIPLYETVADNVDIPLWIIRDLLIAIYDCRGDLKSFNERFENGGLGNSQDKERELRKNLKEHRSEVEIEWKRYKRALKRKEVAVDKTLEKCYVDAIKTTEQATALLEREMKTHLLAALELLEDKPPKKPGLPTPEPKPQQTKNAMKSQSSS
jgi:hypothetical protein